MNKQKFSSLLGDTLAKLATWRMVCGVMLISNVGLVLYMFQLETAEKTIIAPPNFDRPFSIQGDEVSPSYIEQMTHFFAQQRLTYNKRNAGSRFDALLPFFSPAAYSSMQAALSSEARRISRNDISSVFHPMAISIDGMTAIIKGELIGMMGSRIISKKVKSYRFEYAYRNGLFSIVSLREVLETPGGDIIEVEEKEGGGMVDSIEAARSDAEQQEQAL